LAERRPNRQKGDHDYRKEILTGGGMTAKRNVMVDRKAV
jgi:hypothetical protein